MLAKRAIWVRIWTHNQKIHPFVCAGSGVTLLMYVGLYTLCFVIKGSWRHVDGVTFWRRSIRSSPPVRGADLCEGNQTVLHPSLTLTLTPVWCHWSSFFFFLFSLLPCLSLLWLLPPSEFVSLSLIDLQIYSLENQDHFLGGWMLLSSSRCHFSLCDSVFFFPPFFNLFLDLFFGARSVLYIMVAGMGRLMWCSCCHGWFHCVDSEVHIKGRQDRFNKQKKPPEKKKDSHVIDCELQYKLLV